jgi:hypothetical protein
VISTAPQAPRMNAHCERIIGEGTHVKYSRPNKRTTTGTGLTGPATSYRQTSKNTPHQRMISMALAADHFVRGSSVG